MKLIDGKLIADKIAAQLKREVSEMTLKPSLSVIQVGNRHDSSIYVKMKQKQCLAVGIEFSINQVDESITQEKLLSIVKKYNRDYRIHGILVQLPLPAHIDEKVVTQEIDPRKDVDGFHSLNIGRLVKKDEEPNFVACTPLGIVELLLQSGVQIAGKEVGYQIRGIFIVLSFCSDLGSPAYHT